jgi:dihydroneopterin aldolase / 2-amino-4-hydroxy-6-hydroxymethyldihydropteridine diphosphokinase / dihydropteroate synthase
MTSLIVNPYSTTTDSIIISSLRLWANIGPDRWAKPRPQPITLSLHLECSLAEASATDDVTRTVDYGQLTKLIIASIDGHEFGSLRELADAVLQLALSFPRALAGRVDVQAHNQFLLADALGVTLFRDNGGVRVGIDRVWIRGLKVSTIVGVNQAEREWKQIVEADVTFDDPGWITPDFHAMHNALAQVRPKLELLLSLKILRIQPVHCQTIETSSYLTLESLATAIARTACHLPGAYRVTVQARKPCALVGAAASGVEITRDREFFQQSPGLEG